MARTSQRDRAQRDASSGSSRSHYSCRDRTIWRYQSVAPTLGVDLTPVNLRDPGDIERAISAFARSSSGGLIVTAAPIALVHRDLIVTLANRHKLCAVYNLRSYVTAGGLI